ncbi:MAG: hypothetical protein JWM00_738 [Candidatus Saccharibacteria bacterium]|nr:hypothetical protein [Candidatus Saccharibacteria bacterium]
MELVKKLEVTLAGWYKQVPFHLPVGGRKWLSENVWWIVLIGVIAGALSIIASVQAFLWAEQVSRQYRESVLYYGITPTVNDSMAMTVVWVSVLFYVAVIVLELLAISPLRARKKRGWNLLFLAMLVSAISGVVIAVLQTSVGSLLGTALGLAIGGYFLFEIHSHFGGAQTVKKAKPAPHTAKK